MEESSGDYAHTTETYSMMRRTRVKMCGTTRLEDAEKAIDVGVDALGFIFVPESPRFIEPEQAREITTELPPFVSSVGVFVNEGIIEIEEIVDYLGLSGVQLHGDEDQAFCEQLGRALPSCTVMKALRISEHTKKEDLSPFNESVSGFVLDSYVKGQYGGTGKSFDYNILERLSVEKPIVLAGGLTPENIRYALETCKPFAVDVNSGIEIRPGMKDHQKLESFIAQVRSFDYECPMPVNVPR